MMGILSDRQWFLSYLVPARCSHVCVCVRPRHTSHHVHFSVHKENSKLWILSHNHSYSCEDSCFLSQVFRWNGATPYYRGPRLALMPSGVCISLSFISPRSTALRSASEASVIGLLVATVDDWRVFNHFSSSRRTRKSSSLLPFPASFSSNFVVFSFSSSSYFFHLLFLILIEVVSGVFPSSSRLFWCRPGVSDMSSSLGVLFPWVRMVLRHALLARKSR